MKPLKRRDKAARAVAFAGKFHQGKRIDESSGAFSSRLGRKPVVVTGKLPSEIEGYFGGSKITLKPNTPGEVKRIVSLLSRHGILVPEFIAYKQEPGLTSYAFERIGSKPLSNLEALPSPNEDIILPRKVNSLANYLRRVLTMEKPNANYLNQLHKYLSSAARSLGTMHKLGLMHGHAHFGNFVPVKSQVAVIDFHHAKTVEVNWAKPEEIIHAFYNDYAYLDRNWGRLLERSKSTKTMEVARLRNYFFGKLVEKYPTSQKNKQYVFEKLVEMSYWNWGR